MPFALIIIGAVLTVAGVRNTTSGSNGLFALVSSDFSDNSNGSFTHWMVAILILGALGYSDTLKPLSRAFTVLVIIAMFVSNGGFFQKFNADFFAPLSNYLKGSQQ